MDGESVHKLNSLKKEMGVRERILATASDLFYKEGIRAIGVDTVVAKSGVAKASLYRLFKSKDELIAAFMTERDKLFWEWWDRIAARHADDPQGLFKAILAGIAKQIGQVHYRGCPFLNLAAEFPEGNHPGRIVARANKDELRRRLEAMCGSLNVADPARTSRQLLLLINGAYATGQMDHDDRLGSDLAEAAIRIVIDVRTAR